MNFNLFTVLSLPNQNKNNRGRAKRAPNQSRLSRVKKMPVAKSRTFKAGNPVQRRTPDGVEVTHTEFLADLHEWDYDLDPDAFAANLRTFYINPGVAETFPWLSEMATLYEKYKIIRLEMFYLTSSSTQERGKIVFQPDYDITDNAPTFLGQMLNSSQATYGSLWNEVKCRISPAKVHSLNKQLYVRKGDIPGEPKSYDGVKVFVTVPGDGTRLVGSLFIKYCVRFYTPQVSSPDPTTPFQRARYSSQAPVNIPNGETTTHVHFTDQAYDTIGIQRIGNNEFVLPPGTYRIKSRVCFVAGTPSTSFSTTLRGQGNSQSGNESVIGKQSSATGDTYDQTWGGYFVSTGNNPFFLQLQSDIVAGVIALSQIAFERLVTGALQSYLGTAGGLPLATLRQQEAKRLRDRKNREVVPTDVVDEKEVLIFEGEHTSPPQRSSSPSGVRSNERSASPHTSYVRVRRNVT